MFDIRYGPGLMTFPVDPIISNNIPTYILTGILESNIIKVYKTRLDKYFASSPRLT